VANLNTWQAEGWINNKWSQQQLVKYVKFRLQLIQCYVNLPEAAGGTRPGEGTRSSDYAKLT
jgi:hypothetical protein